MESKRLRQTYGYLLCLTGGALCASLIWAVRVDERARTQHVLPQEEVAESTELKSQIQRLEKRVLELQGNVHAASIARTAHGIDVPKRGEQLAVQAGDSDEPVPATEEVSEQTEEALVEQAEQRINERYAALEKRFSDEPADDAGSRADEQAIRQRFQALEGYELSKVECKYTMCRLDVISDAPSAAGVMRRLGFKEGGEIRRRDDGTFLIFAGREGFPFQELNGLR